MYCIIAVNAVISVVKQDYHQKNRPFDGCLDYMVSSLISAFVKEGMSW